MLQRFRQAGLVWPTLCMLPALGVLIGLGVWQMQRKAWKDVVATSIRAHSEMEPPPGLDQLTGKPGSIDYARVRVTGAFVHAQERYLYAPDPRQGPGYHVYTPLKLSDGSQVYVNRGFVTEALKEPARRPQGQVAGQVAVTGLIRLPGEKGYFTPDNDPARNIWYWRDIPAMFGCADGRPGTSCLSAAEWQKRAKQLAPFSIDAELIPPNTGGWPKGGTTILNIPNRHLEYAITWFGLAATLIGVYLVFAMGRLRAGNFGRSGE